MSNEKQGLKNVVSFRLSDADYEIYQGKLQASGMTKSAFFREYVLTNRTEVMAAGKALSADQLRERAQALAAVKRAKRATSEEKRRLLYLFNKTSNNINQLAHRANSAHLAGKISDADYSSILNNLELIVRYMKAIMPYVD